MSLSAVVREVVLSRPQSAYKSLTLSGNEITDAVRTTGEEGDGLTPPAGVGIWPAATNLVTNGGFETNTTGWATFANRTIARTTALAKFGAASMSATHNTGSVTGTTGAQYAITLTAAAYTWSLWLYIPSSWTGSNILIQANNFAGATLPSATLANLSLRDQWQRLTYTFTPAAGDLSGDLAIASQGAWTAGESFYVDGVQVETGPIATPYIETDGGTASRTAGRVQQPVSGLFTATQGWVAARVATGWANGGSPGNPRVFEWADDTSNYISLIYNTASNLWQTLRVATTGNAANVSGGTFSANTSVTTVGAWYTAGVKTSIDGSAFTVQAVAEIPTLAATTLDIGSFSTGDQLAGRVLWYATGSGTLTDADAAALNAYGDRPPILQSLREAMPAANPTSLWNARNARYEVAA